MEEYIKDPFAFMPIAKRIFHVHANELHFISLNLYTYTTLPLSFIPTLKNVLQTSNLLAALFQSSTTVRSF